MRMSRTAAAAFALGLATLSLHGCDDETPTPPIDGGSGGRGGSMAGSGGADGGATGGTGGGAAAGTGGTGGAMAPDGSRPETTAPADGPGGDVMPAFPAATADQVISTYKMLVHRTYQLSVDEAGKLKTAITAFVAAPDAAKLMAAKQAWLQSRLPYNQTDAYRFYDGPIDNEEDGPEGAINGWPLDENYIDYTRDATGAGIINNASMYPQITAEALGELNEVGGEKNLATGYHAIEFLLWGQDDTMPGMGTGKRPHTDFVTGAGATAMNQARRRAYLTAVTDLLVENLEQVRDAWVPGNAMNYGAKFGVEKEMESQHNDAKKDAIAKIIEGLGSLARGELSGERMTVAYKNRDQEEEHSCFSDSTWPDLYGNAKGIKNVWTGSYEGTDLGPGLDDLVKAVDPAVAMQVTTDIDEAVAKMKSLSDNNQQAPFDVVINEPDGAANRMTMLEAMRALKRVANGLEKAATTLGLKFEFEPPSVEL
jgi:putative iron-regulated protein